MKSLTIKLTNMKPVRAGKGITKRRERLNMSLLQLSEKSGISESKLQQFEEGNVNPVESGELKNIATALGMRIRGKPNIDDIVNFFLCVPEDEDKQLPLI